VDRAKKKARHSFRKARPPRDRGLVGKGAEKKNYRMALIKKGLLDVKKTKRYEPVSGAITYTEYSLERQGKKSQTLRKKRERKGGTSIHGGRTLRHRRNQGGEIRPLVPRKNNLQESEKRRGGDLSVTQRGKGKNRAYGAGHRKRELGNGGVYREINWVAETNRKNENEEWDPKEEQKKGERGLRSIKGNEKSSQASAGNAIRKKARQNVTESRSFPG